jgi:uncharacterized protein (DUF1697 family)
VLLLPIVGPAVVSEASALRRGAYAATRWMRPSLSAGDKTARRLQGTPDRVERPDRLTSVSRYVAFLRGMNVGGHRLTNDELRAHFGALGFGEVATFRASGNVIFAAGSESEQSVGARIEAGLAERLGYAVPTFVRSEDEVRAVAAHEPFAAHELARSNGKLQVSFLSRQATREQRDEVLSLTGDDDLLAFASSARELYWLPSGGMLESALELTRIDRVLGASTMRTKGTVELIAAKHCAWQAPPARRTSK